MVVSQALAYLEVGRTVPPRILILVKIFHLRHLPIVQPASAKSKAGRSYLNSFLTVISLYLLQEAKYLTLTL